MLSRLCMNIYYSSIRSHCCIVAKCTISHSALTTVQYRLLIATNNKLFLVIFTRELQNLERMIYTSDLHDFYKTCRELLVITA